VVLRAFTLAFRGHRELVLENLALRQQLAAYHRTTRCRFPARDRLFWIALAQGWRNWRPVLVFVPRHRRARASRLAPPPMGSALETSIGGPSPDRSEDPRPRSTDGHGESLTGSTADSRGVANPRRRRLRADGVASARTADTAALAVLENLPDESPHVGRSGGFLHRAHAHRLRPLRAGRVGYGVGGPCISTSRSIRPRHGRLKKSSRPFRTTPRRHGCVAIATASTATASTGEWRAWASPRSSQPRRAIPTENSVHLPVSLIAHTSRAAMNVALFLPFGSNKTQQTAARRDPKRRSKPPGFANDGARCSNVLHAAAKGA